MTTPNTPWQKGAPSPNPRGRPKKGTFALGEEELRKLLKTLSKVSEEAIQVVIASMREGTAKDTSAKWLLSTMIQVQRELDRKLELGSKDKIIDTPINGEADEEDETPKPAKFTMKMIK